MNVVNCNFLNMQRCGTLAFVTSVAILLALQTSASRLLSRARAAVHMWLYLYVNVFKSKILSHFCIKLRICTIEKYYYFFLQARVLENTFPCKCTGMFLVHYLCGQMSLLVRSSYFIGHLPLTHPYILPYPPSLPALRGVEYPVHLGVRARPGPDTLGILRTGSLRTLLSTHVPCAHDWAHMFPAHTVEHTGSLRTLLSTQVPCAHCWPHMWTH